jgi:hypothetical protein
MSDDDRRDFPQFAFYVRVNMPQVTHVQPIVHNMRAHGSLSLAELSSALVWGALPRIVIRDLSSVPAPDGSGNIAANGLFDPANPDQVELDIGRVRDFERDSDGDGSDVTSTGRKVYIVGTTLLHELCHWGNFHHGRAEAVEEGIAFEVAVYGRNTG